MKINNKSYINLYIWDRIYFLPHDEAIITISMKNKSYVTFNHMKYLA